MAQHTMSPEEIEAFGRKLEAWSKTLTDNERTFFKFMLERDKTLSPEQLDYVSGGAPTLRLQALRAFQFQQFAPVLDFNYFRVECW